MDELRELTMAAVRQGQKGFYGPAAVAVNQRILALDPKNVAALLRLARCHTEARNWKEAHQAYRRLLELGVGDAGRVKEKLAETARLAAEQEEMKQRAAERERADEELRREERRRRFDETRAEAQAIGGFLEARTIAIAHRELMDYDAALIYHERSLQLAISRGDRIGALAAQASTLRRAGRPAEALRALEASIAIENSREKNKPTYTSFVATLRELGRLEEARREGEELIRIFPDDSHALFALARVFRDMFEREREPTLLDQAALFYTRATALQPPERNIVRELRALVDAGRMLQEMAPSPELKVKVDEFERHVERLEQRLNQAA